MKRKKNELDEKQMARWAELLNLLADLARAVIADDADAIRHAVSELRRTGWNVSIKSSGGAS